MIWNAFMLNHWIGSNWSSTHYPQLRSNIPWMRRMRKSLFTNWTQRNGERERETDIHNERHGSHRPSPRVLPRKRAFSFVHSRSFPQGIRSLLPYFGLIDVCNRGEYWVEVNFEQFAHFLSHKMKPPPLRCRQGWFFGLWMATQVSRVTRCRINYFDLKTLADIGVGHCQQKISSAIKIGSQIISFV